jgi:hypothetical protein
MTIASTWSKMLVSKKNMSSRRPSRKAWHCRKEGSEKAKTRMKKERMWWQWISS